MTLLELLRQELPKRGGWPEGVNFIAQEEGGSTWSFVNEPIKDKDDEWMDSSTTGYHGRFGDLPEASDHATAIVTREQYGWDGTGLPPVGVDVEFTIGTYDIETDFDGILPAEGEIVEVIAHKTTSDGNDVAVVYWDDKGAGRSACFVPGCLHPLRTEAERAIDEMVRLSGVSIGAAKILYDAGYRKG
jgi:hypothetical protein